MGVTRMNHFTVLTDRLDETLAFYRDHLGLAPGARPPFSFAGAWLYAEGGAEPILHIVAGRAAGELHAGVIDHMAFTGRDLAGTVGKLKARGVRYELRKLPGQWSTWQLFFQDPNGAKVEIDFDPDEPAPA